MSDRKLIRYSLIISIFLILAPIQKIYSQHTQVYTHPSESYRRGLELFKQKKYATAQDLFKKYIVLNRENEKTIFAHYYVAVCALKQKQPDADFLLEQFVQKYPNHSYTHNAYYDWGKQYYENGEYDKAIKYLGKVSEKNLDEDRKAKSQYIMAHAYFEKKQFNQAKIYFDKLKAGTSEYTDDAFYYSGYIFYINKEYASATQDLIHAIQSEAYVNNTALILLDAYYRQNKFDEVIVEGQKLMAKNRTYDQIESIFLLLGDAYYQRQKYRQANKYYLKYINIITKKAAPEVSFRLAYTQYQIKDYDGAILNFQKVALLENEMGQIAAFYLGKSYLAKKQKQYAITAFEQVKKYHFNKEVEEEAIWALCKLYYEQEDYDEALTTLKVFVKNYPTHKDISIANDLLSQTYLYSKNYPEAIAYIESLPQKTQKVKLAYQQITYSQATENFNNENYLKAIELFKKSINVGQISNLVIAAKYWMAEAYSLNQDPQKAIESYQAILDIFNQENYYTLKSHYGLGYAYYNTQRYDLAIPHFQKYIVTLSGKEDGGFYADALVRLADCFYAQKEYNTALDYYDKVISADYPDKVYAYFRKGVILATEERDTEAHANLDKIINDYSNSNIYDEALYTKGAIFFERRDFSTAVRTFGRLVKNKPQSSFIPKTLLKRGIAYKNLGQQTRAVQDFSTIVERFPTHTTAKDALYELQELLSQNQGELNRLLTIYRNANPNSTESQNIYIEQAKNAFFSANYSKAINLLNAFVNRYPKSTFVPDAEYFLGESYYRKKNFEKSLQYHNIVVEKNKSNYITRSALRAGELCIKLKEYENAVSFYRFLNSYTDSKRQLLKSWEGLIESYYALQKNDSVSFYANEIILKGQGSKNKAWLYKGKLSYKKGKYTEALAFFNKISTNDRDKSAAEAHYLKGVILTQQKKYKESNEVLLDLNKKFTYELWRGKGQLLMADNFIQMGEKFQAKATLENIIDKIQDRAIIQQAKEKLKTL